MTKETKVGWNWVEDKVSEILCKKKIIKHNWADSFFKSVPQEEADTIKCYSHVFRTIRALHKELYHDYLQSPEWKAKRNAVLERDKHKCRICDGKADRVHHMTYDRKFNEPLYDLISVCKECHTMIHLLDR